MAMTNLGIAPLAVALTGLAIGHLGLSRTMELSALIEASSLALLTSPAFRRSEPCSEAQIPD